MNSDERDGEQTEWNRHCERYHPLEFNARALAVDNERIKKIGGHLGAPQDPKTVTEPNEPNSAELYMMEEGELKVTWKWDTRVPNCAMFYFVKEDHTLAGMLRSELLRHPHVIFSGYRVPHPLYATFDLRIQTDGEVTPKKALMDTCANLLQKIASLDLQFKHEFAIREAMNNSRATGTGAAGPSGTGGETA